MGVTLYRSERIGVFKRESIYHPRLLLLFHAALGDDFMIQRTGGGRGLGRGGGEEGGGVNILIKGGWMVDFGK